ARARRARPPSGAAALRALREAHRNLERAASLLDRGRRSRLRGVRGERAARRGAPRPLRHAAHAGARAHLPARGGGPRRPRGKRARRGSAPGHALPRLPRRRRAAEPPRAGRAIDTPPGRGETARLWTPRRTTSLNVRRCERRELLAEPDATTEVDPAHE